MDETLNGSGPDESAHTTDRKSAHNVRVEVITRGERRRSWTLEQKREIVAESLGPELTPSEVARKYAIGTGQLYTWRRELCKRRLIVSVAARPCPIFLDGSRAAYRKRCGETLPDFP